MRFAEKTARVYMEAGRYRRYGLALIWAIVSLTIVALTAYYGHWPSVLIMFVLWWVENILKGRVFND